MKDTGIVRRVDELGRIVIPIELRRQMGINEKSDLLEIHVEGDRIILEKASFGCVFCGSGEELCEYMGRKVCRACIDRLKGQTEA